MRAQLALRNLSFVKDLCIGKYDGQILVEVDAVVFDFSSDDAELIRGILAEARGRFHSFSLSPLRVIQCGRHTTCTCVSTGQISIKENR